jgi:hypothetical protein
MAKKYWLSLLAVLLNVICSVAVYGQSSELVGTWISVGYTIGNAGMPSIAKFALITHDKITIYPSSDYYGFVSYSWNDPANDGVSIIVKSRNDGKNIFTPYIVTDTNLCIELPYDGSDLGGLYYFMRYYPKPPSALVGTWIHPEESGDIEVTITDTQITLKKGRLTKTLDYFYYLGDEYKENGLPGVIKFIKPETYDYKEPESYSVPYHFMDDNHVIICLETFGGEYDRNNAIFYLTRQ